MTNQRAIFSAYQQRRVAAPASCGSMAKKRRSQHINALKASKNHGA